MARTVWCPAISGLPSAAPKGARKSMVCAEAYIGAASGHGQVRDSVEIDPASAAAEGSGDPGCGPAAQGGKGHFPE